MKETDATFFMDLTTVENEDIQTNFICKSNGFSANPCEAFTKREGNYSWSFVRFTSAANEALWQINFMRSTLINSLQLSVAAEAFSFFYVEGSVDGRNWTQLYSAENVIFSEGHLHLTKRGFFRHYRIRCSKVNVRYFRWFGYSVEDELFELIRIMPIMANANSINGFLIASTGISDGALYNLTQNTTDNFANFKTRVDGEFWIKYELPEAAVVNFIDIGAPRSYSDRMPTWYKIEASNDDENWTTLVERTSKYSVGN